MVVDEDRKKIFITIIIFINRLISTDIGFVLRLVWGGRTNLENLSFFK